MLKKVRQSLITRLMVYFLLIGLLVIVFFGINLAHNIKVHFKQEILPNVVQYMDYIVKDIGDPPDLEKAQRLSDGLAFELSISGPNVNWQSHHKISDLSHLDFESAPEPYQQYRVAHHRGNNYLLLQSGEYSYIYVVGRLFKGHKERRSFGLLLFVMLSMFLLFWLIRSSLKPLKPINEGVKRIAQGDLQHPIEPAGSIEFKRLGGGINEMSQQIQSMLEAKQELLLAISHELRSPLTRARVNLELLEDDAIRQALVDDIREMEALITLILESERLNQPHVVLNKTSFQLDQMIHDLLDEFFPNAKVNTELKSVIIEADKPRLELLVKNLLDNAIKYSADANQSPVIRLYQTHQHTVIEVQDFGCGMSPEVLQQATQAFYRADPARQRKTGGYGLGLYLCHKIVQAHGGELDIQSKPGEGSNVYVRLPVVP